MKVWETKLHVTNPSYRTQKTVLRSGWVLSATCPCPLLLIGLFDWPWIALNLPALRMCLSTFVCFYDSLTSCQFLFFFFALSFGLDYILKESFFSSCKGRATGCAWVFARVIEIIIEGKIPTIRMTNGQEEPLEYLPKEEPQLFVEHLLSGPFHPQRSFCSQNTRPLLLPAFPICKSLKYPISHQPKHDSRPPPRNLYFLKRTLDCSPVGKEIS